MQLTDRFLSYIQHDTQSSEETDLTPSTPGQMAFARLLADELKQLGLQDIVLDDYGYLMATLPANVDEPRPTVGFIAHMDTSPDMSGRKVQTQIVKNYDGGDIVLNKEYTLSPAQFPELLDHKGEDIICTRGTTLLGADDKAGIAEIVTAMEHLLQHPEIKHGKIRIGFTPDEEIGKGADHFDVKAFAADWAYTMDGGEVGELEFENFNAASAKVIFKGRNVHPGYAKHKMLNANRVAYEYANMLPRSETPEHTEGYEGFYHLIGISGSVEEATLSYIVRDHDRDRFERRKREMQHIANKINNEFGEGTCTLILKDQYYNMREMIEPDHMNVVELALKAMEAAGVKSKVVPIRGGTDGARLSFMGLKCPNLGTGGRNYHGVYEYLNADDAEKMTDIVISLLTKR